MIATKSNQLETGKLYTNFERHFFHHKLAYHILPYNTEQSYSKNLFHNNRLGFMQTPIVSLRMFNIIKLLLSHGYTVSDLKVGSHSLCAYQIRNIIQKTPDLNILMTKLETLDNTDTINIILIAFSKNHDSIRIRNNGLISATPRAYQKLTEQIPELLHKTEECY